ncbi:hypothetical protein C8R47DRAFT_1066586 [Mycena vitilis]|nr:hypothetical protein C8R47DRAFT_1066586 [Mycena vitilis]
MASITFGASFDGARASLGHLEAHPAIPGFAADLGILLNTIGAAVLFPAPRLLVWLTRSFKVKGTPPFSEADIIDQMTTLALGGSAATATTMHWMIWAAACVNFVFDALPEAINSWRSHETVTAWAGSTCYWRLEWLSAFRAESMYVKIHDETHHTTDGVGTRVPWRPLALTWRYY